jgi:hypothetical protein
MLPCIATLTVFAVGQGAGWRGKPNFTAMLTVQMNYNLRAQPSRSSYL